MNKYFKILSVSTIFLQKIYVLISLKKIGKIERKKHQTREKSRKLREKLKTQEKTQGSGGLSRT